VIFCKEQFWCVFCTFHYRPWTGSINPRLQNFQFSILSFCTFFGNSLFLSIYRHISVICAVWRLLKLAPYNQSGITYFRFLKIVQHDIIVLFMVFKFFLFGYFLVGWFEYCLITLRICGLLFKCVFWHIICDMQASEHLIPFQNSNLFSSAHCCLSFRANTFFTWGPYPAFHGMALTCHIGGFMITDIWNSGNKVIHNCECFKIPNFTSSW
jgi:hypothetical protein